MESNDRSLEKYFRQVWLKYWRYILLASLISAVVLTVFLRNRTVKFVPKLKMFAHISKNGLASAMGGGLPELERAIFISSQQELVFSFLNYQKVQKKIENDPRFVQTPKAEASYLDAGSKFLSEFLFGAEKLLAWEKWRDAQYLGFRQRVYFEQQPASGTFTLGYADTDPERAIIITKFIADSLIELNYEIANKKRDNLGSVLQEKVKRATVETETIRKNIEEFIVKNGLAENPRLAQFRYQSLLEQKKSLLDLKAKNSSNRAAREALKRIANELKVSIAESQIMGNDRKVQNLVLSLQEYQIKESLDGRDPNKSNPIIQRKLAEIQRLDAQSPKHSYKTLVELQGQIETLINEKSVEHAALSQEIAFAEGEVAKLENELLKMPKLEAQMNSLEFELKQRQKLQEVLTESYLKTENQGDTELTQLFAIEEPMITDVSFWAYNVSSLGVGIFICTILAMIGLGLYHYYRRTILTRHDIASPSMPVFKYLGSIPFHPELKKSKLLDTLENNNIIMRAAQTLKNTMFKDQLSSPQATRSGKVIHLTSYSLASGKSLTALGIGFNLKSLGLSVVILDCDYRADAATAADYLSDLGDISKRISLIKTGMATFGKLPELASKQDRTQLVTIARISGENTDEANLNRYFSVEFKRDLMKLRNQFDVIILDSPPMFFTDSLVLSSCSDGAILCVPEGEVTCEQVEDSLHMLKGSLPDPNHLYTIMTKTRLNANMVAGAADYRYTYRDRKNRLAA